MAVQVLAAAGKVVVAGVKALALAVQTTATTVSTGLAKVGTAVGSKIGAVASSAQSGLSSLGQGLKGVGSSLKGVGGKIASAAKSGVQTTKGAGTTTSPVTSLSKTAEIGKPSSAKAQSKQPDMEQNEQGKATTRNKLDAAELGAQMNAAFQGATEGKSAKPEAAVQKVQGPSRDTGKGTGALKTAVGKDPSLSQRKPAPPSKDDSRFAGAALSFLSKARGGTAMALGF